MYRIKSKYWLYFIVDYILFLLQLALTEQGLRYLAAGSTVVCGHLCVPENRYWDLFRNLLKIDIAAYLKTSIRIAGFRSWLLFCELIVEVTSKRCSLV